jgi:linoleate 10R-lipoxygenase
LCVSFLHLLDIIVTYTSG